jgi:hypothetical protein
MPTLEMDSVVATALRRVSRDLRADARAERDRARRLRARSEALRHGQVIRRNKVSWEMIVSEEDVSSSRGWDAFGASRMGPAGT